MNSRDFRNIDDKELLSRFYADESNEWLGILLQRYTMLLFGVCMKYLKNEEDAKDAVQQVFFKVIAELHKYKVDYFKSWLYMVAKNHCLMKLRNNNYHQVEIDERVMAARDPDEMKNLFEKETKLNLMAVALLQLNQEQQQCVTLFYLEKKSYQQISDQTGYSLMQIKSFIQNGKRNLKIQMERLQQNGEEE